MATTTSPSTAMTSADTPPPAPKDAPAPPFKLLKFIQLSDLCAWPGAAVTMVSLYPYQGSNTLKVNATVTPAYRIVASGVTGPTGKPETMLLDPGDTAPAED